MALTHFFVTNDLRSNYTNIPGLLGVLSGHYIYYDSATGNFIDTTSIINSKVDNVIAITLWDTPSTSNDSFLQDWEIDTSKSGLQSGSWKTADMIDDLQWGDGWREVKDDNDFNIIRNRAFTQLFGKCVANTTTREPVGYNTSIRISNISNGALLVSDPIIYEFNSNGIVNFYFSPEPATGWLRCYPDEFYDRISVPNPDYNPKLSTALSPCDADGWRTVINAPFYGEEQNFYPNDQTDWWDKIEGLGHNTKVRFLDSFGKPLLFNSWYPMVSIKSGVGGFSSFGTNLGQKGVDKVEIRYVEQPDWVINRPTNAHLVSSNPANDSIDNKIDKIELTFNKAVTLGYGEIELEPNLIDNTLLTDIEVSKSKLILTFNKDVSLSNGEIILEPYSDTIPVSLEVGYDEIELEFSNDVIPGDGNIIVEHADPIIMDINANTQVLDIEFSKPIESGHGKISMHEADQIVVTNITSTTTQINITFSDELVLGDGNILLEPDESSS